MSAEINNFEIILGTYEEFTLGYKFQNNNKNEYSLTQSFATHDHSGSVRCVDYKGKFMATGGSDDRVCVYDMVARREQAVLTHHSGTVTCVAFTPDGSHLLTSSDDSVLAVVRTGNWKTEKLWSKVHNGTGVQMIAIHPSGKLALTLGKDITLRTWNLVKGRQAYVVRLKSHMRNAYTLSWSLDEKTFVIFSTKYVELWNIESGGCIEQTECKVQVSSCCWLNDQYIVVGHEDGTIIIFDRQFNIIVNEHVHQVRVKCLKSHHKWLISADSSGKLIVWKFQKNKLKKCCEISAGCRITSMCIMDPIVLKNEQNETESNNDEINIEEDDLKANDANKMKRKAFIVEEHDDNDNENVKKKKKKIKKVK